MKDLFAAKGTTLWKMSEFLSCWQIVVRMMNLDRVCSSFLEYEKSQCIAPTTVGMRTAIEMRHASRTAISVMISVCLLEFLSTKLVQDSSWFLLEYVQCKKFMRVVSIPEEVRELNFFE